MYVCVYYPRCTEEEEVLDKQEKEKKRKEKKDLHNKN